MKSECGKLTACQPGISMPAGPLVWLVVLVAGLFACSAAGRPDPWTEYVKAEKARLEQAGEPGGFYSVYEGSFGPAKMRLVTWMLGDDLFRVDSDMNVIKVSMGWNGDSGWVQMQGGAPRQLSDAEKADLLSSKYFDGLDYLNDPALKSENKGATDWDGTKVWEIDLTSPQGYRRDNFIKDGTWDLAGYR